MIELNLQALTTIAGLVIFIELVMQLLWKPLVKNLTFWGYAAFANNLAAFVLGLIGALGAGALLPGFCQVVAANLVLIALVAAAIATGAYEAVKNIRAGVRKA